MQTMKQKDQPRNAEDFKIIIIIIFSGSSKIEFPGSYNNLVNVRIMENKRAEFYRWIKTSMLFPDIKEVSYTGTLSSHIAVTGEHANLLKLARYIINGREEGSGSHISVGGGMFYTMSPADLCGLTKWDVDTSFLLPRIIRKVYKTSIKNNALQDMRVNTQYEEYVAFTSANCKLIKFEVNGERKDTVTGFTWINRGDPKVYDLGYVFTSGADKLYIVNLAAFKVERTVRIPTETKLITHMRIMRYIWHIRCVVTERKQWRENYKNLLTEMMTKYRVTDKNLARHIRKERVYTKRNWDDDDVNPGANKRHKF